MVTLWFPTATPFSNSNSFRKPKARSNHFAVFFGSRTARPKWPTSPGVNGTFIGMAILVALLPPGRISRNEQFHEPQVEIVQGVTRCVTQTAGGSSQLRPDIGEPNAADHSKLGTQLCGRTAWMHFQEIFHVLF